MIRPSFGNGLSRIGLLGASILLVAAIATIVPASLAADFSVSPMSLKFPLGTRSGEIQVRNLDQQPIRFQVRGVDWSQDESGKDSYVDSQSLIWFPRALELGPGESRIIRVGVRAMPGSQERAYILILQEVIVEGVKAEQQRGAQVRLLLSVSVPIFVPPAKPEFGGSIESMALHGGTLNVAIGNTGNQHFSYREASIVGLGRDGTEKFTKSLPRSTLLAGSRQRFEVKIPQETCRQLRELALTVLSPEQTELKRRLDVSRADCE